MSELDRKGQTAVLVNWENDGDPGDGVYDDITADVALSQALVVEIGRDTVRLFGRPRANTAEWLLRNTERRYSSEYTGSPLRGELQPGRRVWITKTLGDETVTMADPVATMADPGVLMSGVSTTRLFSGNTRQPKERYGPGPRNRWVDMSATGALAKLQAADDVTITLRTDITTGAAALLVLAAAGLTSAEYSVDQEMIDNGRVLDWWYCDRRRPLEALIEIWASEGPPGALYEDQYGVIVLEGSTYLADATRSNTVQATYYSDPADGDLAITGVEPAPSFEQIVNSVTFQLEQRVVQSTTQVAEFDGSFNLANGEVRTIIFRSSDPLAGHTTPALTTDYTVTGTALASVTSAALGALAVAVTFTAGAGSATVGPPDGGNGPRLRGQPLTLVGQVDAEQTVDSSDSQAEFGVRTLPSSMPRPWVGLRPTEASGVADAWVLAYQQNRPAFVLTLVNRNGPTMLDLLRRRVSDLIELVDPDESGASRQLTIHSIRHEIQGDHHHRVILGCEARFETDWARWDVGQWDVDRWGQ